MTQEWNNRNKRFDSNGRNARESFEEHNERMVGFRRSHASVALVNGTRLGKSTLLESMRLLQVPDIMMETGGSASLTSTVDWSVLSPMRKVAPNRFSQN